MSGREVGGDWVEWLRVWWQGVRRRLPPRRREGCRGGCWLKKNGKGCGAGSGGG